MWASLKCQTCGSETDALVPNETRIGDEVEFDESDGTLCEKCSSKRFVRILQDTVAKHGSWGRW